MIWKKTKTLSVCGSIHTLPRWQNLHGRPSRHQNVARQALRSSTEVADASGAKNLRRGTACQPPGLPGQRWSAAVYRQTTCCERASPPGRWIHALATFLIFKALCRSRLSDGILTSKICAASFYYHRTLVLRVETHTGLPDSGRSLPSLHTGQRTGPGQRQRWLRRDFDLQPPTLTGFNFCPRRSI